MTNFKKKKAVIHFLGLSWGLSGESLTGENGEKKLTLKETITRTCGSNLPAVMYSTFSHLRNFNAQVVL